MYYGKQGLKVYHQIIKEQINRSGKHISRSREACRKSCDWERMIKGKKWAAKNWKDKSSQLQNLLPAEGTVTGLTKGGARSKQKMGKRATKGKIKPVIIQISCTVVEASFPGLRKNILWLLTGHQALGRDRHWTLWG